MINKLFGGSWETTVLGIGSLLVSSLVFFGVFSPEDSEAANQAIIGMVEAIGAVITFIVGVIGIRARDNNVSSESANAK